LTKLVDDWSAGAQSAFKDYQNSSGTAAEQSKAMFKGAFQQMDDAVATFATTGKFNFSEFAKSVLKDMATMAAKTAGSSLLSSLFGIASSALQSFFLPSAGAAGASTAVGPGGYTNALKLPSDLSYSPSSTFGFANGGAFTNSVTSGPTLAPMALFGEAGPEAIMPLSRGSDGSLGVRALGGGQTGSTSSNQVVIQQTINVADGQGSGTDTNTQNVARAYAGSARQGAAEQIARDLKPGGQIWSAINGR
jgi:lambda family phage tail tape measure protein